MFRAKKPRGATAIRAREGHARRLRVLTGIAVALSASAVGVLLLTGRPATDGVADRPQLPPAEPGLSALEEIVPQGTPVVPTVEPPPRWDRHTVRSGDSLAAIFRRAGFGERDLFEVVNQAPGGKDLGRIHPGETIAFTAGPDGRLLAVRHIKSPLETVEYRRFGSGFSSEKLHREPDVRQNWATGEITSSLFLAGQRAGMSQNLIMEMANIFGGVIDFVLDPRKGDTIRVVYSELYLDGEKYRDGDILAASFTNQGRTFNAYRYRDSNGDVGYYSEDGTSMRRPFLLAPLDFTRISSNFNLRRLHPIYKTTRPHRGTDYAAPRGTPVYAAGDGKVIQAGYTRANGNYVFIQHGQAYVTRYLHLHKRKVRTGQKVTQNQVIGTVGSTGAATGPHLHYEFLVNGVHRNPRTVHQLLPKARSLPPEELPRFRAAIASTSEQLASLENQTRVASRGGPAESGSAAAAP